MAFKMKGSPMQRNFGIGISPVKQQFGKSTDKPKTQSGEGKAMKTAKKRPTINLPQEIKDKLPTDEQRARSKGTLKGRTGFEYDVVDPIKSKVKKFISKITPKSTTMTQEMVEAQNKRVPTAKKVKDYFTKR